MDFSDTPFLINFIHIHRLLRKIFFRNILHKFLSAGTIQKMFLFHMLSFKLQKYFKVGKSYCTFLLKFYENCEDSSGFYPVLYYVNLYTNLKIYFFCFISGWWRRSSSLWKRRPMVSSWYCVFWYWLWSKKCAWRVY